MNLTNEIYEQNAATCNFEAFGMCGRHIAVKGAFHII
jgi:hypothetical protein